jgi:hypothetical protein
LSGAESESREFIISDQESFSNINVSTPGSDADEYTELQEKIGADLQVNIKHKPVEVPRHESPFKQLPPAIETTFWHNFQELEDAAINPHDMGVLPEEWSDDSYPTREVLSTGRRCKELVVTLPMDVWFPRAQRWAHALFVLNHILFELEEN